MNHDATLAAIARARRFIGKVAIGVLGFAIGFGLASRFLP